jgi:hypothetical protein
VASVPEGTIKITVDGGTYYQYDRVFYRKISDTLKTTYVIVKSPY